MFPPSLSWGRKSNAPDEPLRPVLFYPAPAHPRVFGRFSFGWQLSMSMPIRRRCDDAKLFPWWSWHRIILFTHSLSLVQVGSLLTDVSRLDRAWQGWGESLALCFCPGAGGLCGLRPSRRPPPPRVGLQDLGGPIPTAGYVNRRSRIAMLPDVTYHKSHMESNAEADDHKERGSEDVGKCPVYFPIASKQRAKIAESLEAEPASAFPPLCLLI